MNNNGGCRPSKNKRGFLRGGDAVVHVQDAVHAQVKIET